MNTHTEDYQRRPQLLLQETQKKLKNISKKNKKLLQSISTHLISNPSQFQAKVHQHHFLQQKYNQLIGFSKENLEKHENLYEQLLAKDNIISELKHKIKQDSQINKNIRIQMEKDKQYLVGKLYGEISSLKAQLSEQTKKNTLIKDKYEKQLEQLQISIQKYELQQKEYQNKDKKITQKDKQIEQLTKKLDKYRLKSQNLQNQNQQLRFEIQQITQNKINFEQQQKQKQKVKLFDTLLKDINDKKKNTKD